MILQAIISQSNTSVVLEEQPTITWEAPTTGDYPELTGLNQIKTTVFSPTSAGDKAYNHHSHSLEFYGKIHCIVSTANTDEEEPGQYVRYFNVSLDGLSHSSLEVILESQDDITKGWTVAGRVCIPSSFAIADGKLYAIVDINDKGASNVSRTGVGVIAIGINSSGSFDTPVWIENVNGTFTAPTAIGGYPSYSFDSTLRTKIRNYLLSLPKYLPTWYYSVPSSDILYSRSTFEGDEISEPSAVTLPTGQILKLWRLLVVGSDTKIAQTSNDGGLTYNDTYDTGIPDQPSRTKLLELNDRKTAIIGNNDNTNRSPLFFAFSSDGLTYNEANVYNIDTETTGAVYSGIYKDTGVEYPDANELSNGKIFVVYSVNKEDIRFSMFDKPTLI